MATDFGKTWWGEHWLRSLENVDYNNRLPRGASYARRGNVLSVKIKENEMQARVRGSRATPYRVTLIVPPFFEEEVQQLIDRIATRPALISKLLNRELDPEILTIAEEAGLRVFPRQWTDFKMQCSCPDWAVPCKHLAAVIYMISREIDNNPFLVFGMHRVDLLAELKKRGIFVAEPKKNDIPSLHSLWMPPGRKVSKMDEELAYERVDFSQLRQIAEPLVQLLPDAPPFYPGGNFREIYAQQFLRLAKEAGRLLNKRLHFEALFPLPDDQEMISHHTRMTFTLDRNNESRVTTEKEGVTGETSLPCLLPLLFQLHPDYLNDYQPAHAGGALERAEEALRRDRDRRGGDTAQRRAGGQLLDAADPPALHRAEGEHGGDVAQQVRPLGEWQPLLFSIQGACVGSQLPAAIQQPPLLLLSRPARHVPDARRVQGEIGHSLRTSVRVG